MKLKPIILACWALFGAANALAEDSDWKTSWDSTLYGYASSTVLNNDSVVNPGNYLAKLAQRTDNVEARIDFKAERDSLHFSARPILLDQWNRNVFGENNNSEGYLSQWQARWRFSEALAISGGRELLSWGPAQFRSPSNPFYFNNGRSNPMSELSGTDTLRVSWSPVVSSSVYLARIYDSGYGHAEPDPWSNSWLAKADWRGEESAVGLALAKQAQQSFFLGVHAQLTVEDAWLLYGEVGSYTLPNLLQPQSDPSQPFRVTAESARRTDVLAGASYTFENGHTLYAEYLRYDHGYNMTESNTYFATATSAASNFPAGNSVNVLATTLTNGPPLLGRDYLYLVWQSNLMESSGFSRLMYTHNLTDSSNQLSGYAEYSVNPHLSAFGLATVNDGGAQRESARLFDQMVILGFKTALP